MLFINALVSFLCEKSFNILIDVKTLFYYAIIPIVLYNGTQVWDVPTRFRDIVYNGDLFGDSIIDFKYDLFDVNNSYTKEELLERKSMTSAIFLLDQKIKPLEFRHLKINNRPKMRGIFCVRQGSKSADTRVI
ncbi:Rpn family recombination-promoting nuclease/putative transposase [Clostridium gasigenes]|uniref:Rpn family recombination-promoting nuclease/putative transposase n=1 Tax=Clostridium gasigenes TaxID=94869 RepID=A0A7X0S9H8_9CLOT|nr:Rpn family recombination-promoting nuclease/putative transposase [Clostridium gasigenes]MBB6713469.1 Rpn family recombination-promoting nuclease/putative transposase [Clostridium gasigenes]